MCHNPDSLLERLVAGVLFPETLEAGPMPLPPEGISEKLVRACLVALEQALGEGGPGTGTPPPGVEPWEARVLAAVVMLHAGRDRSRLNDLSHARLRDTAKGQLSGYRTMLAVAEWEAPAGAVSPGLRLSTSPRFLMDTWKAMEAFRLAVHPKSLNVVHHDPLVFRERLYCFLRWSRQGRRQCLPHVRRFLSDAGLTGFDIDHLMDRVPKARWASYSDRKISEIVRYYNCWNEQFRFMRGEALRSGSSVAEVEQKFVALRQAVTSIVRKRFRDEDLPSTCKPDDAAAWAMSKAVEQAGRPGHGYSYTGSLLWYLVKMAVNHVRRNLPFIIESEPAGRGIGDLGTYLSVAGGGFALVLSSFQKSLQPRVNVIREQMLRNREASDEAVALVAKRIPGETKITANLVAKTRERMLRRNAAVYYVFITRENENPPGDDMLLDWVKHERGLPANEIPTILRLAALTRAALDDPSLGLPLLCTLLVDHWRQVDSMTAKGRASAALDAAGRLTTEAEHLLDAVINFTNTGHNRDIIKALNGEGKEKRLAYLVAPVLCLALLHRMPAHEVVAILLPRAGSRRAEVVEWIETIVERLLRGGGLDG